MINAAEQVLIQGLQQKPAMFVRVVVKLKLFPGLSLDSSLIFQLVRIVTVKELWLISPAKNVWAMEDT